MGRSKNVMTPQKDASGRTATEFLKAFFEYEYCEECHGDEKDHEPLLILGNWFAACKEPEDG